MKFSAASSERLTLKRLNKVMYDHRYPLKMLPDVSYDTLDTDFFDELVHLEYETMRNLADFVDGLKVIFLDKKLILIPELVVAHMCAYVGFTISATVSAKQASPLYQKIAILLNEQTKGAYEMFSHYPVHSDLKPEKKDKNMSVLRNKAPGSLFVQTVRLGRIVWDTVQDLSFHESLYGDISLKKQTELFCDLDALFPLLTSLTHRTIGKFNNEHVQMSYVINQMIMQLGWLMGYFGHLDKKFPKMYLEWGTPCVELFRNFHDKLLPLECYESYFNTASTS